MIVNDIQGDLFENLEVGDSIAHGANCLGFMGAGVAKPIGDNYPINFAVYEYLCKSNRFVLGDCLVVKDGDHTVFNLATQYYPGSDASYKAVRDAAWRMSWEANDRGIDKIKTVRMGAGIGGLDWDLVKKELEAVPSDLELDVYYF